MKRALNRFSCRALERFRLVFLNSRTSAAVQTIPVFFNETSASQRVIKLQHRARALGWWGLALGSLVGLVFAQAAEGPRVPSDLYQTTNIWTVHLRFTTDQWDAMEPKGGGPGGFFGGPFGRGPQGGPGRQEEFGPAMILAPAFLRQAGHEADGQLSEADFKGLSEKWFRAWDKDKSGKLSLEQIQSGLNAVLMPRADGQPGPGPRGGGPPGMGLQGPEGKRNGLASAMGIEFEYVHANLEFENQAFKDVAVRYKGNGTFLESRGSLKRSLKIDLGKFTKGQKLAGMSRLNLHNNVTDASWMNEVLSYRLYRDVGIPAPLTAYARVYVTVPGKFDRKYLGLYSMVEDVDKHFVKEHFADANGALLKPVTPRMFDDLGKDWANYRQTYDPKTPVTTAESQRLMEFCRLVSAAEDAQFAAKLPEYVEIDEFARFMAVMVFLTDLDGILGPGQNLYLYLHPKTQKLVFIPWDQDHSFGQFRGTQEQRERLSLMHPWQGENRFLERVFGVPAFKERYLTAMRELNASLFKPERFFRQVDEIAAVIRPAVKDEDSGKLERFERAVTGQSPADDGFGPPPFMRGGKPVKAFVTARTQSISDQLAGRSQGEIVEEFGFGPGGPRGRGGERGRGGPGGFDGPPRFGGPSAGPGGPAGVGDFGPGNFLAGGFISALDANKDGILTHDEFSQGLAKWFTDWNTDKTGTLTSEQLRAGINRDLGPKGGPFGFGGPGGPRFGPPGGFPPRED